MSEAQIVSDGNSGVVTTGAAQVVDYGGFESQAQPQAPEAPQAAPDNQTLELLQALVAQQQAGGQQPQQPQQAPPPGLPELDDAGKQFWNQFEQYAGVNREQFNQAIQMVQQLPQIQQFVAQQSQQQTLNLLRQEWGNDFDTLMPEISKRFNSLPPQMQQAMDNVDGARLLYAQVMQERGAGQVQAPRAPVPRYDRPQTPNAQQRASQEPQFTREYLQTLSDGDYVKYQAAINYAYANGLVK